MDYTNNNNNNNNNNSKLCYQTEKKVKLNSKIYQYKKGNFT